ncbi:hypothetical protein FB45DRAFT_1040167 [Roridomyces roridus]|uniref:Uncharacterized protein n=1 Tax=Roridomyces roridus TaxID=1738132 RepID=A0AAD7F7R8_9AGAR|nr:hypothetical protein FB45DRAFT_1040167 [Roridomyces roridus]
MANNAPLPDFVRLGPTKPFSVLHKLLWPTSDQRDPIQLEDVSVPGRLATFIREWTASPGGQDPPPKICYIDLEKNPSLAVDQLACLDVLIVRQDYVDVLAQNPPGREYLTGELDWIGKSVGAFYFLFHFFACGQPVFFTPNTNAGIYYFSESGVDFLQNEGMTMDRRPITDAVRGSWTIINDPTWKPGSWWVEAALGGIWTAPPEDAWLLWQLTKQLVADIREMKPWSPEETVALKMLKRPL